MPKIAEWTCESHDVDRAVAVVEALDLAPATAAILVRRGLGELEDARRFLAADELSLIHI